MMTERMDAASCSEIGRSTGRSRSGSDTTDDAKPAGPSSVEDDSALCPLFMDGLPPGFSTHPGLQAIASLLVEDEGDGGVSDGPGRASSSRTADAVASGGGKARRKKGDVRSSPYPVRSAKKKKKKKPTSTTSVEEVGVFLKLWKVE